MVFLHLKNGFVKHLPKKKHQYHQWLRWSLQTHQFTKCHIFLVLLLATTGIWRIYRFQLSVMYLHWVSWSIKATKKTVDRWDHEHATWNFGWQVNTKRFCLALCVERLLLRVRRMFSDSQPIRICNAQRIATISPKISNCGPSIAQNFDDHPKSHWNFRVPSQCQHPQDHQPIIFQTSICLGWKR